MTRVERATVVVIGGGPAGASAVRELDRRGIHAILVERSDGSGNRVGESLAPSANPLLHRLGLHDALDASGAVPSHGNVSSWGGNGAPTDRHFLDDPDGHGWHLDRGAFNAALLDAVVADGATIWRRSRVVACERREAAESWRVVAATPEGTRVIEARWLVDASGRASMVSRGLGVRRRSFDAQAAVMATLEPGPDTPALHDASTLIEAAANGWWYSALLPNGRLVVAWFSDPDLLAGDEAWRVAGWWALLRASEATWGRVIRHGYAMPERVDVLSAGSSILPRAAGCGWIAAGDAAASFDPLSSHGIGSALASGARAAAAIAADLSGDEGACTRYTDGMLADFARYFWLRQAYYAEERRWPDAPFWLRRHQGVGARPRKTSGASRLR